MTNQTALRYWRSLTKVVKQQEYRLWMWLGFLLVALFLFWPFLLSPAFSLVDDGYSLVKGRSLVTDWSISNWQQTLIEADLGRFRPIYLLYFSLMFVLFQYHPIGLWFSQTIVIWLTLGLLAELIYYLTKKPALAVGLPLFWLVLPTITENIFRMGPTEPRQLLLVLVALFTLVKWHQSRVGKWLMASLFCTALAIGTKETALFMIPAYLVVFSEPYWRTIKPIKALTILAVAGLALIVGGFMIFKQVLHTGYVADNFSLGIAELKIRLMQNRLNFAHYHVLLLAAVLSLAVRGSLLLGTKKGWRFFSDNIWSVVFLVVASGSLFFTVAWAFQFERYMYPYWTSTILVIALELTAWWQLRTKLSLKKAAQNQLGFWGIVACALWTAAFFFVFKGRGLDYMKIMHENLIVYHRTYDINQVEHAMINQLLNDHTTTTLYTTNDNYEVIYELGLYLSQFKARPVTVISPNPDLAKDQPGYLFNVDPAVAYASDSSSTKALVGRLADLKGASVASGATMFRPTLKYDLIATDQFWWLLKPLTK